MVTVGNCAFEESWHAGWTWVLYYAELMLWDADQRTVVSQNTQVYVGLLDFVWAQQSFPSLFNLVNFLYLHDFKQIFFSVNQHEHDQSYISCTHKDLVL